MTDPTELIWLYAIRLGGTDTPGGPGVDGETPRLVAVGDLVAVVGTVAAARFDEAAMAVVMDDLAGLEALARTHHAVIVDAARELPTAPLRLATIYRDDESVRRLLRERTAEFGTVLGRIRGHREWGVKVYVDSDGPAAVPAEPAADGARPGTSYLLRRRADRDRGAQQRDAARNVAEQLHTALAGRSSAAHRYPLQDARLSGRTEEMVLNATYLVAEEGEREFREAAADAARGEVRTEVTGPWPPFSFASWEQL